MARMIKNAAALRMIFLPVAGKTRQGAFGFDAASASVNHLLTVSAHDSAITCLLTPDVRAAGEDRGAGSMPAFAFGMRSGCAGGPPGHDHLLLGGWQQPFALGLLASGLAAAANGFGLFPRASFGGLFIGAAHLHLAEDAFALKLFLEDPEGLIDIVFTYQNLQNFS
jgi:hypothetical protein